LLPEQRVGVVVLVNGDADELRTVLTQALVKQFTRPAEAMHTVDHYASLLAAERSRAGTGNAGATGPDAREARTPATPAQLGERLGRYRDPWFGEIAICRDGRDVE